MNELSAALKRDVNVSGEWQIGSGLQCECLHGDGDSLRWANVREDVTEREDMQKTGRAESVTRGIWD